MNSNSLPVAIANIRKAVSEKDISIVNTPRVGYSAKLISDMYVSENQEETANNHIFKPTKEHSSENETITINEVKTSISLLEWIERKPFTKALLFIVMSLSMMTLSLIFSSWSEVICVKKQYNSRICYQVEPPQSIMHKLPENGILLYSKEQILNLNDR